MSEKIKFEFVNNSLTNIAQHTVIQKIGSYFKIPQKMLRAALDEDSLKTNNLVSFPDLRDTLTDEFYTVSYKFNLAEVLDSRKFEKSKLYSLFLASPDPTNIFTIVSNKSVLVMVLACDVAVEGVGGIYMNYDYLSEAWMILPLANYLAVKYPSP